MHKWKHLTGFAPVNVEALFLAVNTNNEHLLFDEKYKIASDVDLTLRLFATRSVRFFSKCIVTLPIPGLSTIYADIGLEEVLQIRSTYNPTFKKLLRFRLMNTVMVSATSLKEFVGTAMLYWQEIRKRLRL